MIVYTCIHLVVYTYVYLRTYTYYRYMLLVLLVLSTLCVHVTEAHRPNQNKSRKKYQLRKVRERKNTHHNC